MFPIYPQQHLLTLPQSFWYTSSFSRATSTTVSSTALLSLRHVVRLTDLQLVRGRWQPPVCTRRNWRWEERGRVGKPSDNGETRDSATYLLRNKRKTAKTKRLSVENTGLRNVRRRDEEQKWNHHFRHYASWLFLRSQRCTIVGERKVRLDSSRRILVWRPRQCRMDLTTKMSTAAHTVWQRQAQAMRRTCLWLPVSTVARTVFWDFSKGDVLFFGLFEFRFLS
jgi:hypothetical protein